MIVSCVIPTHRRPRLLFEALGGINSQSVSPGEVIVVDDADDPDTKRVVEQAAGKRSFALRYLVNERRGGVGSSRNLGAAAATGKVLAFLDDDDYWRPTYLEKTTSLMKETDSTAVVSWISVSRGDREGPQRQPAPGLTGDDVLAVNPGVTGSNLLIDKAAFERVGGYDEALWVSNDKDFFIRLLDAGLDYAVLAEPLVIKRAHSGARLATDPRRMEGLGAFLAKYEHRMSVKDRRILRAKMARVSAKAAGNPLAKAAYTAQWMALGGPLRIIARRKSIEAPAGAEKS
jgi:glycosyltransferase involved in cell wall biosynthesis